MSGELIRYCEPLEAEELAFLNKKEGKDRKLFVRVIRILMLLCFICPFVVAWLQAAEGADDPFSYKAYFLGVTFLFGFAGSGVYIAYRRYLWRLQCDIKFGTKTIECAHITRKLFVPQNNTYHFYIDSPNKLSIEVTEPDYRRLEQGDELNIEYTTYSKMYLGYF